MCNDGTLKTWHFICIHTLLHYETVKYISSSVEIFMIIKTILFALIFLMSLESYSMEHAPLFPEKSAISPASLNSSNQTTHYLDRLPRELQDEVLAYAKKGTGILNIPTFASAVNAMANSMTTQRLLNIIHSLPTRCAGNLLVRRLKLNNMSRVDVQEIASQFKGFRILGRSSGCDLRLAVLNDDLEKVKEIVSDYDFDLDDMHYGCYPETDKLLYSTYPLYDAIQNNRSEMVRCLLEAGSDPDWGGVYGDSNLVKACDHKNKQIISYLLAAGACVNVVDRHGFIPLKHAICDSEVELVAMLLAAGANPQLKANKNESSVLEYAYTQNNPQIIALLEAAILARNAKQAKKERRGCEMIPCTIS